MEQMVGYDRAIVIDAIQSGAAPGTIHHLAPGDMPTQRSASSHDMTLPTALALGRQAELHLPQDDDILLVGIEADDIVNFGEACTPAVASAVPRAVADVLDFLDRTPAVEPGRRTRGRQQSEPEDRLKPELRTTLSYSNHHKAGATFP